MEKIRRGLRSAVDGDKLMMMMMINSKRGATVDWFTYLLLWHGMCLSQIGIGVLSIGNSSEGVRAVIHI